jgi:hypothetical protein
MDQYLSLKSFANNYQLLSISVGPPADHSSVIQNSTGTPQTTAGHPIPQQGPRELREPGATDRPQGVVGNTE